MIEEFTSKILVPINDNIEWANVYSLFKNKVITYDLGYDKYYECIWFNFEINANNATMPYNKFHIKEKSDAMWEWYLKGDKYDATILNWFSEYEKCRDLNHSYFNSNYGQYIFTQKRLDRVIEELVNKPMSRHALMFINSDENQSHEEIDKLCTNCFQFYLRDNMLQMIIQMRASNILTLLPYDSDCFYKVYCVVYEAVKNKINKELKKGTMYYQISSAHFYESNLKKIIINH